MLAIIYKNLIECRKSLLLSLFGAAFVLGALFVSLLISDGGDKSAVVSIMFILGMLYTYPMLGNSQSALIGCDQNSRFYGFIFSAPNGRFKAAPHKDCMRIARSDFSSDCTKATQEYSRISRSFRARLRKICKQDVCKAARRALCGVALSLSPRNTS